MERIQVLIDKLQQQNKQNESASSMLLTIQQLQSELMSLQNGNKVLGTSKVSVVMPYSAGGNNRVLEVTQKEEVKSSEIPPVLEIPQKNDYRIPKPTVKESAKEVEHLNVPLFNAYPDLVIEAPTLVQQQIHKEVNELITNHKEELNDRLKQDRKELAHLLKDAPVKDLRKAIGVNDKFVFISELFRGDEDMYERTIKTINGFHILPEAEYWMNRELKVKLGWNDNKETVQHFYQLVRRRFS